MVTPVMVAACACLAWATTAGHAYVVMVDALEMDCFFERVTVKGSLLELEFETIDGGFLDIDVEVFDPDNESLYRMSRERHGRFATAVDRPGVYHYCFSNKMSTVTPKTIRFDADVVVPDEPDGEEERAAAAADDKKDRLKKMISELSAGLVRVEKAQKYVYSRDLKHHHINSHTNACVSWWAASHAVAMVLVSTFQLYYLTRFFEIRRMV